MHRFKYKLLFVLLFIFSASFSFAQDSWYQGKKISEIRFNGLYMINQEELESITDSYIDKTFDDEVFMELQNKLFALDYFEDMTSSAYPGREDISKYDPENTVVIQFNMIEYPSVAKVKLSGNKNIRKNTILDSVMLKPGDIVTGVKLRLEEERINDLYIEKGFHEVQISGEIGARDENNTVTVTFRIDEGKQMNIKEIVFVGNNNLSKTALRRNLETKKQGLFSKGLYQESLIEEDIEKIESFYSEKGYITARVVDVKSEIIDTDDPEKMGLRLTYYIEEGDQYTYDGISFIGNIIHNDEELEKMVRTKNGDVLNKVRMEADFVKISDLYFDDGYIFNSISEEEVINYEHKKVSYIVTIVESGRAHVENIVVRGNDKTRENVILRELPIGVGDVFSKKKIIEGVQNLYNLQYFSAIYPETPAGSEHGLMDLIVNVEEGKTTDIQFGLTFSADAGDIPVSAFVKWTDRNFRGTGQELSVGTELSTDVQSLSASFTERWLTDKRLSGTITASVSHETTANVAQDIMNPVFKGDDYDDGEVPDPYDGHLVDRHTGEPSDDDDAITDYEYAIKHGIGIPEAYLMEYESWNVGLGLSLGYTWHLPIGRIGSGAGYNFIRTWVDYNDSIYRPYNETVRENFNRWMTTNQLWTSVSWDTRDIVYNPSKGFYLKETLTYTGGILPSDRQYIASTTKGQIFQQLFSIPLGEVFKFKMVLALGSSISVILNQLDDDIKVTTNELLYIDGLTMARGWDRVYDGKVLWDNWVELRLPIFERYIWWDFFMTATGIWPEREMFKDMTSEDFYCTLGGGFRLTIPGLPIGFYFVKRFQYDNHGNIDWQEGTLFKNSMQLDFVIGFNQSYY